MGLAPVACLPNDADPVEEALRLVAEALSRTPLDVSVTHRLVAGSAHSALARFEFEPNDLVLARRSCRAGRRLARLAALPRPLRRGSRAGRRLRSPPC